MSVIPEIAQSPLVISPQPYVGEISFVPNIDLRDSFAPAEDEPRQLFFDSIGLGIDYRKSQISGPRNQVVLTRMPFNVLDALASSPMVVQTHEELADKYWGGIPSRSLKKHIENLRTGFDCIGVPKDAIRTFIGVGYMLDAEPKKQGIGSSGPVMNAETKVIDQTIFKYLGLGVNFDTRTIGGPEGIVQPTAKEWDLLASFAAQPDVIHLKSELLAQFFEGRNPQTLNSFIKSLRVKLKAVGVSAECLEWVPGLGYIFLTKPTEATALLSIK